nr:hypothetical protein [Borreliella spielmanii]WKC83464.1 hypothetical protein QIA25_02480 [Borreliella spielmanii]
MSLKILSTNIDILILLKPISIPFLLKQEIEKIPNIKINPYPDTFPFPSLRQNQ